MQDVAMFPAPVPPADFNHDNFFQMRPQQRQLDMQMREEAFQGERRERERRSRSPHDQRGLPQLWIVHPLAALKTRFLCFCRCATQADKVIKRQHR